MTDIRDPQTTVHDAPPDSESETAPHNVDAHMPPQPGEVFQDPVWATPRWNPETNEWAPSNEQHGVFGLAEPSHGDDPTGDPVSESYGRYEDEGTVPDARLNLIDSVRQRRGPTPAPVIEHHHVVETQEQSSVLARARTIRIQAQVAGTPNSSVTLLEENPKRDRALIKVITTNGQIIISPIRQGGVQPQLLAATAPLAGFVLSQTDGTMEIKSGAGVEAVLSNGTAVAACDVTIWEELQDVAPGLI